MAAKPKAGAKALPRFAGATVDHVSYHPDAGILRINVTQDGPLGPQGKDIDIAIADVPADIRTDMRSVFTRLAAQVGATPMAVRKAGAEAEREEG